MSVSGRIKTGFRKAKGKIAYNSIVKRAQKPSTLNMSVEESEKILAELDDGKKYIAFGGGGVTTDTENLVELSIIIPVYNGEKFLKDCINSVLNQRTKYSFEVICVDDGSTDSSFSILQSYANDSRIKIIEQENKGISSARNAGLKKAKGKYVMLVDNDDMLAAGTFQLLLDYAIQYNADIVKCGHKIVGKRQYNVIDSAFYVKSGRLQEELISYNGYIWGMVIKRKIFQKVRFPEGFWYEDMITRLLVYRLCNGFVYVDRPLYLHRMHSNNASAKVWNAQNTKALDQFVLAKEITEHADFLGLPLDEWVYRLYLSEFGRLLYDRTISLDIKVRQAVFMQCSILLKSIRTKIEIRSLSKFEWLLDTSLIYADFVLWESVCKYYL